jgi:pSer/pThr/pTyr-binding forkhead associated (FHA) protein
MEKAPAPSRPAPAKGPARKGRARISAIARDGSRSADYLLVNPETRVGKAVETGEVKLDQDPFVAPLHAVLRFEGEQLLVQDLGSPNGTFLGFKERKIEHGAEVRLGRQRLRIDLLPEQPPVRSSSPPLWGSPDPGYAARAVQLFEGGAEGDVFPLRRGENLVGRLSGDITFPQDGYISSKHAAITVSDRGIVVKDLGSANGTFVRIAAPAPIALGDLLLIGEQILRVDPA